MVSNKAITFANWVHHTKFEVSMLTHYEEIKGVAECEKSGGLAGFDHPRSAEMSPFNRSHMTSYLTNRNYASILPFSSYSKLFVKSCLF